MTSPDDDRRTRSHKADTRRLVLLRRDALAADVRAAASAAITARVVDELATRVGSGTIGLYATKGSEVDTAPLDRALRARGFAIAYPRVVAGDRALAFHVVDDVGALVSGTLGIREPDPEGPAIELGAVAAFVIPGVAFDRDGGRLGYGRGHYDTTLAAAPHALRIGVAFDCQLVDRIAGEGHDIPLQLVITELATFPGHR